MKHRIKSIGFEILEKPQADWVEIWEPELFDNEDRPARNGPIDLRLGALFRFRCRSCYLTAGRCKGHFGYIKLPFRGEEGFTNIVHPIFGHVMKFLPVLPNSSRKIVEVRGDIKFDDVTLGYVTVLNVIKKYGINRDIQLPKLIWNDMIDMLQFFVGLIYENKKGVTKKGSNDPVTGIIDSLKGKQGILRRYCLGKRVDNSARTVFTVDPKLGIDEIGIPKKFMETLETQDGLTYKRLIKPEYTELVEVETGYRFVKEVWMKNPTNIRIAKDPEKSKQYRLIRHLKDGDWVMHNRQPSLHRMNILGLKVVGHKEKVISMNPSNCMCLNADVDGDATNIFVPQSAEAQREVAGKLRASLQIQSPRHGKAIIFNQQDFKLLEYMQTGKVKEMHTKEELEEITGMGHELTQLGVTFSKEWMRTITTRVRSKGGPGNFKQMFEEGPVKELKVVPKNISSEENIKASFMEGFGPMGFWEHASQGRLSLADKSNMPAKTGYMQRKLVFALGDFIWDAKKKVTKDSVGNVVSYIDFGSPTEYSNWVAKDGEMVGMIAAQSIGEASTQTVLRSFHKPGELTEKIRGTGGFGDLSKLLSQHTGLTKSEILSGLVGFFEGQGLDMDSRWLELAVDAKFIGASGDTDDSGLNYSMIHKTKQPLHSIGFERIRQNLVSFKNTEDNLNSPFSQVISGVYKI